MYKLNDDFSLVSFESVSTTSDEVGYEISNVFTGKYDTFWKPKFNTKEPSIQINFHFPHIVKAIDILFHNNNRYIFDIWGLDTDNVTWILLDVVEKVGDLSSPIRFNIPTFVTKSIKIRFLSSSSSFDDGHHISLIPEISELRVYGQLKDEYEARSKIPPLPCPQGYYKKKGECIKADNNKKTVSKIELINDGDKLTFTGNISITGFYIEIEPSEKNHQILIQIPNKYSNVITIQKELYQNMITLNNTIEKVNKIEMILLTDMNIKKAYVIGYNNNG